MSIEHIKLDITPVNYVELRGGSKILTVSNDDKDLVLCIQDNFSGKPRKRKVFFLSGGDDVLEPSQYITTIQIATDPFGGVELKHIYIED